MSILKSNITLLESLVSEGPRCGVVRVDGHAVGFWEQDGDFLVAYVWELDAPVYALTETALIQAIRDELQKARLRNANRKLRSAPPTNPPTNHEPPGGDGPA